MRRYTLSVNDQPKVIDVEAVGANLFRVKVDGRLINVTLEDHRDMAHTAPITPSIYPTDPQQAAAVGEASSAPAPRREAARGPDKAGGASPNKMTAPMPGVILSVTTTVGAKVKRGEPLLVLEAMKMKNELKSPRDGRVAEIYVSEGQQVKFGEFLVRFEG